MKTIKQIAKQKNEKGAQAREMLGIKETKKMLKVKKVVRRKIK